MLKNQNHYTSRYITRVRKFGVAALSSMLMVMLILVSQLSLSIPARAELIVSIGTLGLYNRAVVLGRDHYLQEEMLPMSFGCLNAVSPGEIKTESRERLASILCTPVFILASGSKSVSEASQKELIEQGVSYETANKSVEGQRLIK